MQLLELTIDDTSPLISYSPVRDTLSTPNLTNAWNPYYNSGFASSLGQVGVGESYHITSMDGAYLSVKWNGNGIRLAGNTTLSSFNITLDGADFKPNTTSLPDRTLVDICDLQDGDHTITLTARIPQNQTPRNSSIAFDAAVIRTFARGASSDSVFRQKPLDTNSISFNGRWSFGPIASGQSFHTSNTTGDRASTTFNGTAFILRGMTTLDAGNYSVTLDGITTTLSSQSSFTVPNTTLFLATGLNGSVMHSVEVTNNGGKLSLLEDGFWTFAASPGPVYTPDAWASSSDRPLNGGTVAAFALAGVLFAILITTGLFFIWRKRRRRRNDPQSITWDNKRFMVDNPKHGTAGSFGSSWRFGRRTRTSYDVASLGAKGDTMTLESARWQREAVEGNVQGISLPILFKHSVTEIAMSPEAESPESKHPYSVCDPISHWERPAATKKSPSTTVQEDMALQSATLANLRNKGKARQITGAASTMEDYPVEPGNRLSFSPNDLLQGLHVKMSTVSRIKTPRDSVSLSLNPSSSPVPGQQNGRHRNSYFDQLSPLQAASNPSIRFPSTTSPGSTETPSLPSVPRSVSDSNANTIVPHHRQSSPRYLLDDPTELDERYERDEDVHTSQPLPPPPHVYRNQQGNGSSPRSIPKSLSLRQVVRSLSPRISEMGMEDNRHHNPSRFYAPMLAEGQSILEEDRLVIEAPSTPSARDSLSSVQFASNVLPLVTPSPSAMPSQMPTERQVGDDIARLPIQAQAEPDGTMLGPTLPSLKRTSPFNIRFDWQSERESKRVSDSSRKRAAHFASRDDVVQPGTSRNRTFRLTPSTMTYPPNVQSYAPSQISTDVVTSFLDFTNSSENSSIRTNTFSIQSAKSRIFGDSPTQSASATSGLLGGRMAKLRSRWSDTTSSGRQGGSSREGTTSSGDNKSSRRKTYHTSTIPSITLTSETHSSTNIARQRESDSTQFSTENPIHLHPALLSETESHNNNNRDSLPPDTTTNLFRTSGSDELSGNSRRTTDSSNQFHTRLLLASSRYSPLPEGTDEASTSSILLPQSPSPSS